MEVTLYGLCGCSLSACQIRKAETHTVYVAAEITDVLPHISDSNCQAPSLKGQLPAALSSNLPQHTCLEISSNPEHLDSLQIQLFN